MTGFKQFDIFLEKYCTIPGKVLDVGGTGSIVMRAIESLGHSYESLNIDGGTHDVFSSPYNWSMIEDNTYDYVISLTAFEHIEFYWLTFLEMKRVVKNNGLIYIIAPSSGQIHPNPVDCWRFLPDGMRALAKWGQVTVIDVIFNEKELWHYCEGIFKKER
jgi:hypothetical protein